MNRWKCLLVTPILIVFSASSFAACNYERCVGAIKKIYVHENATYVSMDMDMSPLNCTLFGDSATLRVSHPNYNALLSLLLTAYTTNASNVTIRISENTGDCKIVYAILEKT